MERLGALAEAAALRAAMGALGRRLRGQNSPGGVGPTGLSLLGRLRRDGRASASELAHAERLQPQSLTRSLKSLEEAGLIFRAVDPADRRRSTIEITPAGVDLLRNAMAERVRWLAVAIDGVLSPSERVTLRQAAELMERLAEHGP